MFWTVVLHSCTRNDHALSKYLPIRDLSVEGRSTSREIPGKAAPSTEINYFCCRACARDGSDGSAGSLPSVAANMCIVPCIAFSFMTTDGIWRPLKGQDAGRPEAHSPHRPSPFGEGFGCYKLEGFLNALSPSEGFLNSGCWSGFKPYICGLLIAKLLLLLARAATFIALL